MKIWKFMVMCLACSMAMVSLSACSDDDDDKGGNNLFVGTWIDPDYGDYYTFRSNGTGAYTGEEGIGSDSFSYTVSGSTAILTFEEDDVERMTYHGGDSPYLSDEDGYRYYKR